METRCVPPTLPLRQRGPMLRSFSLLHGRKTRPRFRCIRFAFGLPRCAPLRSGLTPLATVASSCTPSPMASSSRPRAVGINLECGRPLVLISKSPRISRISNPTSEQIALALSGDTGFVARKPTARTLCSRPRSRARLRVAARRKTLARRYRSFRSTAQLRPANRTPPLCAFAPPDGGRHTLRNVLAECAWLTHFANRSLRSLAPACATGPHIRSPRRALAYRGGA